MNWLSYLLEANLYLILFYTLYYLLLRRETWHQYNRAYLLGLSLLAFVIPVLQLGFLKPVPSAILLPNTGIQYTYAEPVIKTTPTLQDTWNANDYVLAIYLAIVVCLLTGFTIKTVRLILLSHKGTARDFGKWKIIHMNMESGAFSFFNYMFVSADMATSETVITHELVHIRQKHSWDIIYLEIFRIINWFNPVAYLLQRSMKELHEFVADEASSGSKEQIDTYTDFLVANAYGAYEHQLTNNLFNQSLLKKRIMMLHQKRSGSSARLKYLLVLPLLGGALCASTLAFAKDYGIDIAPRHSLPNTDEPADQNQITFPMTVKADKPAGIPLLSKGSIGFIIDPNTYSFKSLTDMSLKFGKRGYKMDFDEYRDNENNHLLKLSLRKAGTEPGSGSSATFKVDEMKKGYAIFIGADAVKNLFYVRSHKFVFVKDDTSGARKRVDSAMKETNQKIRSEVKSQIDQQKNLNKLPAAPEQPGKIATGDTSMHAFYMQIARNTRYPAAARDNKVTGRVFAVFNVDENNDIINIGVLRSPDKVMSQEVVRVLKGCSGKFKGQTDVTYTIPVSFNLAIEQTGKYLDASRSTPKPDAIIPRDQSAKTSKNIYLNEVVVTSYIKQ